MKKVLSILSLTLLAASCNPFAKTAPAGIIKSVNGGTDWEFANTYSGSASNLAGVSVSKLSFDPSDRQILYVGTYNDGMFKSSDSAGTWSKILSNIFIYDFVIDPQNPKIIYAAGFYANHGRVLRTADRGASWVQVYNEESTANPVRAIAMNPQNPNELVIGTASGSVIKTADSGSTWQLAKDFGDQVNRIIWQQGDIYVLLKSKGLYQTSDFGGSFSELTGSLNKTYSLGAFTPGQPAIEAFSQLYVDPTTNNLIYITSSNGLYKTTDAGKTWQNVNLPVKPSSGYARAIAVSLTSSNIVYTSVGSTIYKSLDGGGSWQTEGINAGGFVNYLLIDPQLPQIVYGGIYITQ